MGRYLLRMTIWIVGGVLTALAALLGYFLGAIRAAVSLIGVIASAALAKLVGGWMAGLVPSLGLTNPIWAFYVPPLLGFVVCSIVFLVLALVVHHFIQSRLRNNTDEYSYQRWERLNRRTGVGVGALVGLVWLVLVATVAYVPGYLATQLADADESYAPLRLATAITHDVEDTGMIRLVERFNPATPEHFIASDVLGLVYNNPSIHSRLASYPPFLGLAEKPEIGELAKDSEIHSLIQSKAGIPQILEHSRIRAVVDNPDLVNELLGLDLADLYAYLRTGVSEKYRDERLLGRWRLNVRRSIAEMKIVPSSKLPAVEFNLLRKALNVYLEDMTLGFTTDNRTLVKVKAKDEAKLLQTVGRAAASGGAQAPSATQGSEDGSGESGAAPASAFTARGLASRAIPQGSSGMDPALAQRYGLGRGGAGGGAGGGSGAVALSNTGGTRVIAKAPAKRQTSTALGPLMSTGEGAWSRNGDEYQIKMSRDGKEVVLDAVVKENQMIASHEGRTLVFDRI